MDQCSLNLTDHLTSVLREMVIEILLTSMVWNERVCCDCVIIHLKTVDLNVV